MLVFLENESKTSKTMLNLFKRDPFKNPQKLSPDAFAKLAIKTMHDNGSAFEWEYDKAQFQLIKKFKGAESGRFDLEPIYLEFKSSKPENARHVLSIFTFWSQ